MDDLVMDGELIEGAAGDETCVSAATNSTTSDLNLERKVYSFELQIILSQLVLLRKQNEILSTEFDIMTIQKFEEHIRHNKSACINLCHIIYYFHY